MEHYIDIPTINISIGSLLLALSAVMLMIPIPSAPAWHNFRTGRNTLAVAYIVLGALMVVNGGMNGGNSGLSGMITLIVAFSQALLYTRICVLFLKPRSFGGLHYRALLAVFALFSTGLAISYAADRRLFSWLFRVGLGLYALLLGYCSFVFTRNYNETLKHLEYVYDENMHYSLRWVKRCFYSALCIGVMAWFMAVFHTSATLNVLCIFVYTLYYLCMVGYFMRYVNNYGFIVKSDNGETVPSSDSLSAPPGEDDAEEEAHDLLPREDRLLTERLREWEKLKKFRDSHKTIADIVEELETTRAKLNEYMNIHHGLSFRAWRNRLRIEEAKRLLGDSHIPVSGIHSAVGYSDRSNFHREFTEAVGMTPLQYRRQHQ